jgi:hypothetical protein
VLIANKMESNGQQDRIQISESSKQLLDIINQDNRYIFTPGEEPVEIKALNKSVNSYFVDRNMQES